MQYHPELIEQAVWIAARRNAATEHELHRSIDPIYVLPHGDDRDARFLQTFVEWFKRLKLDRFVDETLAHFPQIVDQIKEGMVRLAPRRKLEGAELFLCRDKAPPCKTLVVQLCAESLVDCEPVRDPLVRELQHVADMLDESFRYAPESIDGLPGQQQVVRERYSVLWDIRVEATLDRRRLLGDSHKERLGTLFDRAFSVGGLRPERTLFEIVWRSEDLTHAKLLSWAKAPREWLRESMGKDQVDSSASPGEPCPLCGFPTFDWCNALDVEDERISSRVRESVPDWNPSDGICRQCAETLAAHAVRSGQEGTHNPCAEAPRDCPIVDVTEAS